jgi:tetratricopeptide (TPR) repeat protein
VEVDSTFYPAYGNIGFKYQEMGQYDKAIEYFNKVLEMSPDEPLGYSNRSYCRLKTGDIKGAKSDIEKSLKLYPGNSYAYRIRALIYLEEGKTDKACEDFRTALNKGFTEMYGDEVLQLLKKHCQ